MKKIYALLLTTLLLTMATLEARAYSYGFEIIGSEGTQVYINGSYAGSIEHRKRLRVDGLQEGVIQLRAVNRSYQTLEMTLRIPVTHDYPIVLHQVRMRKGFLDSVMGVDPEIAISISLILMLLFGALILFYHRIGDMRRLTLKPPEFFNNSFRLLTHFRDRIKKTLSGIPGFNFGSPARVELSTRFALKKRVGKGGMAEILSAVDKTNGDVVAIKLMAQSQVDDEDLIKKFWKEAEALERISQTYDEVPVARFIAKGKSREGRPYMALEYLEGQTLQSHLKSNNKFSIDEIIDICRQVLQGLHAAHSLGIWHNDLSPDNIIMLKVGRKKWKIKIIDFGIAKLNSSEYLTRGDLYGKPCYLAPEASEGNTVEQSDLYSLGVTLYHLIEGKPPFDDTNPINVYHQHKYNPVPDFKREIPEELKSLVFNLMKKDPAERPENAFEVLNTLKMITNT